MPPTQTSATDVASSRDALRAEGLQVLAEALERMPAHVEAERFLFEGELLHLRPRRNVRQRNGGRRVLAVLGQVEERD